MYYSVKKCSRGSSSLTKREQKMDDNILNEATQTSVSIKIKHKVWLNKQKSINSKFSFSKFIQKTIDKKMEEENGTS